MSTCYSLEHIRYLYSLQSNQSLITCLSFWMDLLLLCSTFALRWPLKSPFDFRSILTLIFIVAMGWENCSFINLRSDFAAWVTYDYFLQLCSTLDCSSICQFRKFMNFLETFALSLYRSKNEFGPSKLFWSPKWFGPDQNELDSSKTIGTRPKWFGGPK